MTRKAAKGRKLILLAAVCLAASLLLAPSAEASRSQPASLSPSLGPPVALPVEPVAGSSFYFLTDDDRFLFAALSSLQDDELAQVLERRRFRPLADAVNRNLTSGLSTYPTRYISLGSGDLGWRSHQGDYFLEPDPLGPVDSPNLYQAFGFDGLNVVDPWGMCSNPDVEACRENQESIFFRAYKWTAGAIDYAGLFLLDSTRKQRT